jgi:uncharacterized protein YeaO (DUF488 family)
VYLPPEPRDGRRILVDRLWPRGIRKDDAAIDLWARELAPSDALRAWFARDPAKWVEFKRRYFAELDRKADEVRAFAASLGTGRMTFVFAKTDETRNNAVALTAYLERRRGGGRPSTTKKSGARGRPSKIDRG